MDTKKTLKIGSSDFARLIRANSYFVDKTMLIKDFFENDSYIILLPRPKRFGKTLNLSMIEHFFDIQKPESKELFSEFEISKHKAFCKKHQNKYPVINISLKRIRENNWERCSVELKYTVADIYEKYSFLLDSEKLTDSEKTLFSKIINKTVGIAELKNGLQFLSRCLKKHFNKEVIILVDEYDTPIIRAFLYTKPPIKVFQSGTPTYYEEVINFMQGFLGEAFKGNPSLAKGMLTGVMRIGKESIFSEWNNFSVFGITSEYFSDSFGFTEDETQRLLTYFDLKGQIENVKKWYDGYQFGKTDKIYNPWSIVNYVSKHKDGFRSYWVNSGDYSLIKSRIIKDGAYKSVQDLIEGKFIEKELHENFVFQDFETNRELLWTMLTDNGYLTQLGKAKYGNYKLRVPNMEVKSVFTDIISEWFNKEVKIKRALLIRLCENLINNRLKEFEYDFRMIMGDTISYFDTSEKTDQYGDKLKVSEQIYHVYMLGVLTILSDDYIIKSNRESGEGRYDIMLIPYDKTQNGIVIEFKTIVKQAENESDKSLKIRVNKELDLALNQIENKKYFKELLEHKIKPENILKVSIVFVGKMPYITKL